MTERREPGKCQNFVFCKGNKKQQNTALKLSLYWVCLIKAISLPKSWQKKNKKTPTKSYNTDCIDYSYMQKNN